MRLTRQIDQHLIYDVIVPMSPIDAGYVQLLPRLCGGLPLMPRNDAKKGLWLLEQVLEQSISSSLSD